MTLTPDRFYVGDVPTFLMLVKILKTDPEFCICFDFGCQRLEIESMMMSGLVAVGIRLVQGPAGIIVASPITRTDRITMRVDSNALYHTLSVLNNTQYAYMSLGLLEEDGAICIQVYSQSHVLMGSATMHTLNLEEHDTDFLVVHEETRAPLSYDVIVENTGKTWRSYMQTPTVDATMRFSSKAKTISWETASPQSRICLVLPVVVGHNAPDVCICLLPVVVGVLRSVLQLTTNRMTTLSIGEDLPLRLFAPFDANGSFIRVYAGTKDDN